MLFIGFLGLIILFTFTYITFIWFVHPECRHWFKVRGILWKKKGRKQDWEIKDTKLCEKNGRNQEREKGLYDDVDIKIYWSIQAWTPEKRSPVQEDMPIY
jgi:hypothetical protein